MEATWHEIGSIFQQVFDLPVHERRASLDRLCPQEGEVREEVESLLRAHDLAEDLTREGFAVSVGELSASGSALAPDRRLGPYTVLRELGHGGMSTVFLAARTDDAFDRLVAVKILRSVADPELHERFLAERQVHAALEHPGIARLYGGGTTEHGTPYIVMEYVEDGRPLDAYCNEHRLDARARVDVFRQVCGAVAYAHQNLVVHRDLKPNNILIGRDGSPKLLDFGISKLLSPEGRDWDPTQDGPGPLTPGFASPEQVLGEPITTASDVFSLGVLLFQLLAGDTPFPRTLGRRTAALQEDRPLPSLEAAAAVNGTGVFTALDRGRRQDLEAIVRKALRTSPRERYGTVGALDADLRRWQEGLPVTARRPTWTDRLSRFFRRHWLPTSFAAAVVITLAASSWILAGQKHELAAERDRARAEAAKSEKVMGLLIDMFEGSDPVRTRGADLTVGDVLRGAEPRIERELNSQPGAQAELFEAVGRVFLSLGELDDAERLLHRSLERRPKDTLEQAAGLDLLARARLRKGEFHEALKLLEAGNLLKRRLLGPDSREEAAGLARIAYAHLLLYRPEAAETAARRALGIFREAGDEGFVESHFDARFNLGEALYRQRGREAAEPVFEELLSDAETTLGPLHPKTLSALGKLADMKGEHPAQFELAESYARRKLEAQRRLYKGDDHPEIAVSLDVLGGILARKGNLEESLEVQSESVAMRRRLVGDEGPFLAVGLGNLGWFHLFRRHDPRTAEPILREALDMAEKFFPPDATLLAYPLIGVGRCRTLAGEPEVGEPYLRRARRIRVEARGPLHLSVARAELYLGESLTAQGRCGEAAELFSRVLPALEAGGEPDDATRLAGPREAFRRSCSDDRSASAFPLKPVDDRPVPNTAEAPPAAGPGGL